MALVMYDVLGRKWAHTHYSAAQMLELCPQLTPARLISDYHYLDAQTDDARLELRVLHEAVRDGGAASIMLAPQTCCAIGPVRCAACSYAIF